MSDNAVTIAVVFSTAMVLIVAIVAVTVTKMGAGSDRPEPVHPPGDIPWLKPVPVSRAEDRREPDAGDAEGDDADPVVKVFAPRANPDRPPLAVDPTRMPRVSYYRPEPGKKPPLCYCCKKPVVEGTRYLLWPTPDSGPTYILCQPEDAA